MLPLVVRPEELARGVASLRTADDGTAVIDLPEPRVYCSPTGAGGTFWGLVLLIAVRDRATSVHYHPWRGDGALFEVVEDTRYGMVAPDVEAANEIIETARSLFVGRRGLWSRLVGRGSAPVCGSFSLEVVGQAALWDAIVWSNGERSGVELIRVTPLEPREPSSSETAP